ncbi:putative glycosyl transferase [uncultured Clostridium sp.]|uniref:Glycosyltransferase family 2 protein n=1 Tax=Muricoprocola aceti TaxID=2981772 RepID=A0ABT2SPP5_9FIRM|nr:glycosyltransferase family A protein [Muricoprocola aceti]MCU6726492.1 glycosyltransferase family 2 protein [Muricoprocola aceti]SCH92325.1 putative glycosyl transferase [uncultured Clostridium sp.]
MNNNRTEYAWLSELTEHTAVKQYLNELESKVTYINKKREDGPFLTVLVRTQGKREMGLRESLLCLNAQSFNDFEIILIAHKANEEGKKVIKTILDDQADEFREKIRYFELENGTRTEPLNFGFSHAQGKYIAIFDDDDILFEGWAEAFYEAAKENDGRVLHSYAFSQGWKNIPALGYRAETKPSPDYCSDFNLLLQFLTNKCPLMTLAFPTNVFQNLGIKFNDSLNIMEDWEYFMRVAGVCGVTDIQESTAIYRMWENIETSATLHDKQAWWETYTDIQLSFSEKAMLLPQEQMVRLMDTLRREGTGIIDAQGQMPAVLHYANENGFNDLNIIRCKNREEYPKFKYIFEFDDILNDMSAMRVDLKVNNIIFIEDITVIITYENGVEKEFGRKELVHTGFNCFGGILFARIRPEILVEVDGQIKKVTVKGKVKQGIMDGRKANTLVDKIIALQNLTKKQRLHKKGLF